MPDGVITTVENMAEAQGQPIMTHKGLDFEWSPGIEISEHVNKGENVEEGADKPTDDNEEEHFMESYGELSDIDQTDNGDDNTDNNNNNNKYDNY